MRGLRHASWQLWSFVSDKPASRQPTPAPCLSIGATATACPWSPAPAVKDTPPINHPARRGPGGGRGRVRVRSEG